MSAKRHRCFTLIELMVVIAILGLLATLLLPAIMAARESSRNSQCKNNLRQIGVALQNYHASNNCFPQELNDPKHSGPSPQQMEGVSEPCSALVRLLPFLDQGSLYSATNFLVENYPERGHFPNSANQTVFQTTLSVFLCPTDYSPVGKTNGTNYCGNWGVGPFIATSSESPDSANGFLGYPNVVSIASISDGLSHTVAYSERLRGSGVMRGTAGAKYDRDFGDLSLNSSASFRNADYALDWCRIAASRSFPFLTDGGYTWFVASRFTTGYCHAQEPNGLIPDAINLSSMPGLIGIATARSLHKSTNTLMGDASVRGVKDGMDRSVWRALGTRNGGELVD